MHTTKHLPCSMNYLAHAYLSFGMADVLVGNLISDFVKGKQQYTYSHRIWCGIRLHRFIDTYTDAHEATKQAKTYLQPSAGRYAGAFVDVVYDHFLAQHLAANNQLQTTATYCYQSLLLQQPILPERFVLMLPHMIRHNWLGNYQHLWAMEKSFGGVVHRSNYLTDASPVYAAFITHYDALKTCYQAFFPMVNKTAASFLVDCLAMQPH